MKRLFSQLQMQGRALDRRRSRGAAHLAAAALALLVSTAAFAQPGGANPPAFNAVLFEEHVHAKLGGVVKGYAFAVSDGQGIQARAAGGWAQDPADGNVKMSSKLPSGIGSVTKMMSGAALLHLFERRALASTTVQAQLDMPMLGKLPPMWQQQWHGRNLERISYRHLLQHRSGFRDETCGGPQLQPLDQMAAGVKIDDIGKLDCYNNFNYYLLRYLIASIAYPADAAAVHRQIEALPLAQYTEKANIAYSLLYERFMRDEFLPRSLDKWAATCRPYTEMPKGGVALGYGSKDDHKGAFTSSRADHVAAGDYCPSQGSWYVSAEGLALFGRNLLYTDRWLSRGTVAMLFDPANPGNPANPGKQFPWSEAVAHEGFANETGQAAWPSHGGDQNGYRAALVQLPYGHVGAALINSGDRGSAQIAKTLVDAFYAATRGEPVARARHGQTPAEYQRFVTEMDEGGSRIDWIDFYNVGDKVFVNTVARPASPGTKNYVRHDLTSAEYQNEVNEHVKSGKRRLLLVDSYLSGGQVRYAFVMAPGDGSNLPAYHGVDAARHKELFDNYSASGFVPTSVSVVSVNGERRYATTWTRGTPGGLIVRSWLDGVEFQQLADKMARDKMELAYLNTYVHQGEVQYSVVFVENIDRPQVWKHGMSAAAYQTQFDTLADEGFSLRLVAGVGTDQAHRFAAVWQR